MSHANETIDLLLKLRAIRELKPDPIPDDVMADLLEVIRWSGSANNRQPWEVIVVTDRGDLETLAQISPSAGHAAKAGAALVLVFNGEREAQETFDEGRLSERIMLAAKAHGLGSCVGWFNGSDRQTAAKDFLSVPQERTLRSLISIGAVDEPARAARGIKPDARKPLDAFVHMGHFGANDET